MIYTALGLRYVVQKKGVPKLYHLLSVVHRNEGKAMVRQCNL